MFKSPLSNIDIVLIRPQHSGNIGAIARSIANHGLGELILVDPPAFDPDRARWMAPHAHHIVNQAKIVPDISRAISKTQWVVAASARDRKWEIPTLSVEHFCARAMKQPCAIVFGPEDSGLFNKDLQYCHAMVTLPTHGHNSLNLSQAVNVFGAHLINGIHSDEAPQPIDDRKTNLSMQNRFVDSAMRVLDSVDFFRGRNPMQIRNQLLRLIERTKPTTRELANIKAMGDKIFHRIRVLKEKISTLSDESQKK